jgi:hypothetical protein
MARKTPPCPEYPEWTTAKYFSNIRTGLRAAAKHWPPKVELIKESRERRPILDEDGNKQYVKSGPNKGKLRERWENKCDGCGKYYPAAQVEVDHIIPAGTLTCFDDVVPFIKRLFVSKDKLQILCKGCHQAKTNEERRKK